MSIITYETSSVSPFILPSTKPKLLKICICYWNLNFLGYHIWGHPVLKNCTWCAEISNFGRADTTQGFGRPVFPRYPILISPKFPCAWWCIYVIWFCYNCLKMILGPASVTTMNARHPQPYFLTRLRKWYIMSVEFETNISNMSSYFSISHVAWR